MWKLGVTCGKNVRVSQVYYGGLSMMKEWEMRGWLNECMNLM